MCPLWPLHIILLYLMALCPIWFVTCTLVPKAASQIWSTEFKPSELSNLVMFETETVEATISDWNESVSNGRIIKALVADPELITVQPEILEFKQDVVNTLLWKTEFNVTGKFLGYTSVSLCQIDKADTEKSGVQCLKQSKPLDVIVHRDMRILDKIFTGSVVILVSIIFINFGCALDLASLKHAIEVPIGPIIGLISHFFFMPLISFALGLLLFPDSRPLRLGIFFAGVSPAGGASNIWTYALGGNLNLSVMMTAVSTLTSFVFIPLWVFTLGSVIFSGGPLQVPYGRIMSSAIGLFIPLIIGYLLQVYCKKLSSIMVRILKPFSAFLIIFIVIFAVVTNFYLFKLFTWQILLAGFLLPCLGYIIGWILATLFKQKPDDKLAISIETGVQNTGMAIFLLRVCLFQPAADITTIAPVAVAIMTPIPVFILYLYRRYSRKATTSEEKRPTLQEDSTNI